MNNKMSDEGIKKSLEILSQIQRHCNYTSCRDCTFADLEGACIFFNKPWDWALGDLEENL